MKKLSIRQSAGRGAIWQVLAGGWQALVRLGASIILARALVPSDFGLFGMALLIIEFVNHLGSLGMTSGIIAKKEVDDRDLSTCFWTMAGIRVLMFSTVYICAPYAATFMREPRIEAVIRVVCWTFIISIVGLVGNTILSKNLEFGKMALINAIAIFFESSLAVYLATSTELGYWALVYPMIASSLFIHLSLLFASNWMPKLSFDKKSFRFQFNYGINGLGFNITNYLHQNLDYLIVGRVLGAAAMGLYEYAYRIPHIVIERISKPVSTVIFPSLSKVQDDNEAMVKGFCETIRYVSLVVFPILGGLAILSKPLVVVLWGEKWLPIVFPMQVLCLAAAIRSVLAPIGTIFLCKRRPDIPFKFSIIRLIFTFLLVGSLSFFFGLNGVALGILFSIFPSFFLVFLSFKMLNASLRRFLFAFHEAAIATLISMVCAFAVYRGLLITDVSIFLLLISAVIAGIIGYFASLFFFFYEIAKEIINMIKTMLLGYTTD